MVADKKVTATLKKTIKSMGKILKVAGGTCFKLLRAR